MKKPIADSTPEMIQKRTTTRVSFQPFFSKVVVQGRHEEQALARALE